LVGIPIIRRKPNKFPSIINRPITIAKRNYHKVPIKENLIFNNYPTNRMAEEMFMYGVTAGVFAFLVAILFVTRGAHKRKEPENKSVETESHFSGSPGSGGKRIKRFKSDGSPVYE
jgi:hypothetical protein